MKEKNQNKALRHMEERKKEPIHSQHTKMIWNCNLGSRIHQIPFWFSFFPHEHSSAKCIKRKFSHNHWCPHKIQKLPPYNRHIQQIVQIKNIGEHYLCIQSQVATQKNNLHREIWFFHEDSKNVGEQRIKNQTSYDQTPSLN